jgi:hypothetical protein
MSEKRFTFEGKEYVVKPISRKAATEGQKIYTKAFKRAVEEGAILKKSLDDHMRRQGLWDDTKQEEYMSLIKKSQDIEYKIKSRFYKKASELRDKALELKRLRNSLSSLLSEKNSMDSVTAEGQAENERFNYFVSVCVYDFLTQKPVFSSQEDYVERGDTELAGKCASEFANYFYGLEENYEDSYAENRVLKRIGLIDDKGNLIDRQGRRVDTEGNLLDENGARVDENGQRIDINNNPIISDDVLDSLEFEDDLAVKPVEKPVIVETVYSEETDDTKE